MQKERWILSCTSKQLDTLNQSSYPYRRVDLVIRGVREHGLVTVGSALRFLLCFTAITRREYIFCLLSRGPRGLSSSIVRAFLNRAGTWCDAFTFFCVKQRCDPRSYLADLHLCYCYGIDSTVRNWCPELRHLRRTSTTFWQPMAEQSNNRCH
jgi:hypothetical protein